MARINENIGPILDALGSPGATDHTVNWRCVAEILDAEGWDGESLAPDDYGAHAFGQRIAIDAAILVARAEEMWAHRIVSLQKQKQIAKLRALSFEEATR